MFSNVACVDAVGWWFGTPILEDARVDLRSVALALAATVPLLAFVYGGMRAEFGFGARLQEVMRDSLVTLVAGCSVFELLIISIMAGIGEEVFFRGFLQGALGSVISPWIALALFDFAAILMISRMLQPPATEPEVTSTS